MKSALKLLTRKPIIEVLRFSAREDTNEKLIRFLDFTVQDINKICVHS